MATRPPIGMPALSRRAKRVLITVAVLVVLAIAWFQFVNLFVAWSWFSEVGYSEVFSTEVLTRVALFLIFGIGVGALVFVSLLVAYRSRPVFVPSADVDPLAPYRTVISSHPRLFAFGISGLIGLISGLSAQGSWTTVQLWMHGGTFGQTDPQFGNDVGFYVFRLPLYQMILNWLFIATALCFVAVLVVQYVYGGLRVSGGPRKVTSQAALQLSVLVGIFVLIKAVQYWFDRYDLLFSQRGGTFTGASYTDVNAVLPAKIILLFIAAICAIGFFVGAIMRSVKLPAIALALLVLSSVLIGGVWPLVLQQVVVNPNGINKEPPYITRNIDATRDAYNIRNDEIKYVENYGQLEGSVSDVVTDTDNVPNARLLDPNILSPTFTQQQQVKNFYGFPAQLSVDRYTIDGKTQDYVVAARELNVDGLADNQKNWISEHIVYTHGNGFVAAPANTVADGYPAYTVSDVTSQGAIKVTEPRIYFGELSTDYAIVGAEPGDPKREYDTDTSSYTYQGKGGVDLGNLFRRLVFATHYSEANFLFSSEINGNSKILYNRDPKTRVEKVAPFLTVDTKPYPAVVNGRIVWIVDGYTTATNYPYSENVSLSEATNNSLQAASGAVGQPNAQVSYIRNSVKATVDAYDGTVTLYGIDESDPVLKAWEGVFPGLIKPASAVSKDLRSHFRYPEDLFEVQRTLLVKYHVNSPVDFFQNSGFWQVPDDPTVGEQITAKQPPYYLQVTLPGSTHSEFALTSALTAFKREFLASYITASSDPADYGKLTVLVLRPDVVTPGPALVQQLFNTTQEISSMRTLASNQGSRVVFGNLLTLPVRGGLLYVEPLYIQGQSSTSSYPQLAKVLVFFDNRVGVGNSLVEALAAAAASAPVAPPTGAVPSDGQTTGTMPTGSAAVTSPSGTTTPATRLPASESAAIAAVQDAYNGLEAAKVTGDQGKIGAANKALEEAVQQLLAMSAPSGLPTPSLAPSSGG